MGVFAPPAGRTAAALLLLCASTASAARLRGRDADEFFGADQIVEEEARKVRKDLLAGCGEVCDSTPGRFPTTKGPYFDQVRKHVDCQGLLTNLADDAPATEWPPPKQVPLVFKSDYTMGGFVQVKPMWFAQRYSAANASGSIKDLAQVWERTYVDALVAQARKADYSGNLSRAYGVDSTRKLHNLLRKHSDLVKEKHFFVIGSERPWLEALLLEVGAKRVTTIEYGKIHTDHPQLEAVTPEELRKKLVASKGKEPKFDGGASFSSVEHSGLGRYGDRLNPWADLQTVAKAWCYTRPKGPMFMGVPSGVPDTLFYNAHRVYGPLRWPQLMANWEQLDSEEGPAFGNPLNTYQHSFLFRRMPPLDPNKAHTPTEIPGIGGGTPTVAPLSQNATMAAAAGMLLPTSAPPVGPAAAVPPAQPSQALATPPPNGAQANAPAPVGFLF